MYSDSVPIENRLLCGASSPGGSVWLACHSLHAEERKRPAANWLQEVSLPLWTLVPKCQD